MTETKHWKVEIRQTQTFTRPSILGTYTRDFDYECCVEAPTEENARDIAIDHYSWTPEKFFNEYYDEGCPPPNTFTLETKILSTEKIQFLKQRTT